MKKNWLVRPKTIKRLWYVGYGILALTVLAQLIFPIHGHYAFEEWLGFNAVYGLVTCAAMVFFAKALSKLIKRKDTYYDD